MIALFSLYGGIIGVSVATGEPKDKSEKETTYEQYLEEANATLPSDLPAFGGAEFNDWMKAKDNQERFNSIISNASLFSKWVESSGAKKEAATH